MRAEPNLFHLKIDKWHGQIEEFIATHDPFVNI